mmetsp:Transcript_52057/g.119779  ORF Transcript_52057/g.119779 Transcript_52057/m.119779 type:complete len:114 (-) Transcript_52057:105-446(-)
MFFESREWGDGSDGRTPLSLQSTKDTGSARASKPIDFNKSCKLSISSDPSCQRRLFLAAISSSCACLAPYGRVVSEALARRRGASQAAQRGGVQHREDFDEKLARQLQELERR